MLCGASVLPQLYVQTATGAVLEQLIKSQIKSGQMMVKNPSEFNRTRSSFHKSRCRLFVSNQYKIESKPLFKLEVLFVYRPFVFQCISLKLPGVI